MQQKASKPKLMIEGQEHIDNYTRAIFMGDLDPDKIRASVDCFDEIAKAAGEIRQELEARGGAWWFVPVQQ